MKQVPIFLISFLCLSHQIMPAIPAISNPEDSWSDATRTLFYAVNNNELDLVTRTIADGADINARNDDGTTPLMLAANLGNSEIVHFFVNSGANVNAVTEHYRNIVDIPIGSPINSESNVNAVTQGYRNIVDILIGSPIKTESNVNAVTQGYRNIVDILIRSPIKTESKKKENRKLVKDLVNPHFGWTSLMYATDNGYPDIARILLDFGADPDQSAINKTARLINPKLIDKAILANRKQILKELKQYSALISKLHKNSTGSANTPFIHHIFKHRNKWQTSKELAALTQ